MEKVMKRYHAVKQRRASTRSNKASRKINRLISSLNPKMSRRAGEGSIMMIVMKLSLSSLTQHKEDQSHQHQLPLHKVLNLFHNHRGYQVLINSKIPIRIKLCPRTNSRTSTILIKTTIKNSIMDKISTTSRTTTKYKMMAISTTKISSTMMVSTMTKISTMLNSLRLHNPTMKGFLLRRTSKKKRISIIDPTWV